MTASEDRRPNRSPGVPAENTPGASPVGHEVGGVGGRSAVGAGLGGEDGAENAAGSGISGGAATGEGLNDIGVAGGGLGGDPDVRPTDAKDATPPPPGPGVSGDRG